MVSDLIRSLAWPFTVIFCILLFKAEIQPLINAVTASINRTNKFEVALGPLNLAMKEMDSIQKKLDTKPLLDTQATQEKSAK